MHSGAKNVDSEPDRVLDHLDQKAVFELEPPPYPAIGDPVAILLAIVVSFIGLLPGSYVAEATQLPFVVVGVPFALALGVGSFLLVQWFNGPPPDTPRIALHSEHLEVPSSISSRRLLQIRYDDISEATIYNKGENARWVVATASQGVALEASAFASREDMEAAIERVRGSIALLPDGPTRLSEMDARLEPAHAATLLKPTMTMLIAGAIGLVFAMQAWTKDEPMEFLLLGANAPLLTLGGQPWRLVTANFLHANYLHLFMNLSVLTSLGSLLEVAFGRWRYGLILGVSCVGGALLSALWGVALFSVGVSTGLFGILGALAVAQIMMGRAMPFAFRQSRRWWLVVLGINGLISVAVPQIDGAAHLGGFAAGAAVAFVVLRGKSSLLALPTSRKTKIAASALASVFAISIGAAVHHGATTDMASQTVKLIELAGQAQNTDSTLLNNLAWTLIERPGGDPEAIEAALGAASLAVDAEPDEAAYRDTLALALFRAGRLEAALAEQRRASELDPTNPGIGRRLKKFEREVRKQSPEG